MRARREPMAWPRTVIRIAAPPPAVMPLLKTAANAPVPVGIIPNSNPTPRKKDIPTTKICRCDRPPWATSEIPWANIIAASTIRKAATTGFGMAKKSAVNFGKKAIATNSAPVHSPTRGGRGRRR